MLLGSLDVRDCACQREKRRDEKDRARLTAGDARGVHFDSTVTAAPSGRPS